MVIAELSAESGISTAAIKYYVREGLMPAGRRVGYNRTEYDAAHLERLRLIRALLEGGGLSVAAAAGVLGAIDDEGIGLGRAFGAAQAAGAGGGDAPQASEAARDHVRGVMAERGWQAHEQNPGIAMVAAVIDTYLSMGRADLVDQLGRYAVAAEAIAAEDLDVVTGIADRARQIETVVVGTVLGDAVLAGLRRIAQESETRARYPMVPESGSSGEEEDDEQSCH